MYEAMMLAPKGGKTAQAAGILLATGNGAAALAGELKQLDEKLGGMIGECLARKEFCAERGAVTVLYPRSGDIQRVVLVGLGDIKKLDAVALTLAGARLTGALWAAGMGSVRLWATQQVRQAAGERMLGRCVGDGLWIGNFEFKDYKGTAGKNGGAEQKSGNVKTLKVLVEGEEVQEEMGRAFVVGPSVAWARRLAATPPNVANPAYLAAQARAMARRVGLKCEVISAQEARRLGMHALLAVGGGSKTEPCVIVLEWKGSGKAKKTGPVLLVGKAVTFDTGGYSLKPAETMPPMKYDKCGGMAVLGAMEAIAKLGVDERVVGLVPCAENMVDAEAYRPADIVRAYNGVTIEVNNTDAEGRLILADALAYGCRRYRPAAVVDLATLTGGVVVALGTHVAGMYVSEAELGEQLTAAGLGCGERLWALPLWEEYRQQVKALHGDLTNSAGREGAPCTAAGFLSHFVSADGTGDVMSNPPAEGWAHLDIAGVADYARANGPFPAGPSGFGVRLVTRWLEGRGR